MQKTLFALSLGFAGLILATHHGFAQTGQCGPRAEVLAVLADRYGETRQGIGLAANNAVVEIFASDVSRSWSIIATMPNGMTCLVASGEGYEPMREELPTAGEPA